MGDEQPEGALVRRMDELRPVDALLALAFLQQQMVAAVSFEHQFAASGAPETFLRAAVGLELGHTDMRV